MCSPNSGSYSWQIASSQSLSTLCQLVDGHLHVMHPKLHPFTCLSVEVLHILSMQSVNRLQNCGLPGFEFPLAHGKDPTELVVSIEHHLSYSTVTP